ncbi:MAG: hypothetical protein ACXIT9_05870 [Nitritalea sp.]
MLNVRSLLLFLSLLGLFSQCQPANPYAAEQLSSREQHALLLSSIRYLGHLPKKANHDTKFQPVYDTYYSQLALDYTVDAYFQDDAYEYFLASRIAPSLKVKKVATGVKIQRNADGQLLYYEEVFRTWKFEEEELLEKGLFLFGKMVRGEDLTPFLPQHSGEEEYIEFPDQRVYFDVEARRWQVRAGAQEDSLGLL